MSGRLILAGGYPEKLPPHSEIEVLDSGVLRIRTYSASGQLTGQRFLSPVAWLEVNLGA